MDTGANGDSERDAESIIADWVKTNFNGTVESIATQPRWRPHWFVDVTTPVGPAHLLVRGDRVDTELVFPLRHEMTFQDLLYKGGIPVPRIYGWIDELGAFVSDAVPGRADFPDLSPEARDAMIDEYLEALAAIHALDITPFVEAGIVRGRTPDESSLVGTRRFEELYRKQKVRPNPFLEFCLGWIHRHPPKSNGREAPVVWDSGQFHHVDGHSVVILDVEIGHLGDPMMDLAGWRMRDSVLGFGDFNAIYQRYEQISGKPVDMEAIQLHHIAFTLSNELSFSHAVKAPPPGSDYTTNLQWCNETNLYATEAIAEYLGVDLPTVEPIEPRDSRFASAYGHLVQVLRSMDTADVLLKYQLRMAFRLSRHLLRIDEIGDPVVEANLDDIAAVIGHRPSNFHDGEQQLEDYVLADVTTGAHDIELLQLLHRQNLRAQMLNGPRGSAMARHIPLQPFPVVGAIKRERR
jgi:aminoglycoside phosphotransferase (APT) family kinase protein